MKALGVILIVVALLVAAYGIFATDAPFGPLFGAGICLLVGVLCAGSASDAATQDRMMSARTNMLPVEKTETQQMLEVLRSLEAETKRMREQCEKTTWAVRGLVILIVCLAAGVFLR